MVTVGIIGFGSFGKFLAEKLSSYAKVVVYSPSGTLSSWSVSLKEVAQADYLIPAIPLDSYRGVLDSLKPFLNPKTVIVDVCSVKILPIDIIKEYLPNQPVVATHPMFGPESANNGVAGHTIILCKEVSDIIGYEVIKKFAQKINLKIIEMSCEEHDKEIAVVQGLTFFVARTLKTIGMHNQKLHTPSFQRLLNIVELEQHHSQQLFETIQLGNPFAESVRNDFVKTAENINKNLKD
ncbi:MAG: prephenate dehydrogenase/arogenate dehydrogenase family protein [Patescibacteria group bacterium]|nr:prephenate dehydrogenase/arogenate dehydrogenase family protein [Patescibacteria group bacterium]